MPQIEDEETILKVIPWEIWVFPPGLPDIPEQKKNTSLYPKYLAHRNHKHNKIIL